MLPCTLYYRSAKNYPEDIEVMTEEDVENLDKAFPFNLEEWNEFVIEDNHQTPTETILFNWSAQSKSVGVLIDDLRREAALLAACDVPLPLTEEPFQLWTKNLFTANIDSESELENLHLAVSKLWGKGAADQQVDEVRELLARN